MPHSTPSTWWITIENGTGEPVDEFGVGLPGRGDVSLAEAQTLARQNITSRNGRAIIHAVICTVDANGTTELPAPPLTGPDAIEPQDACHPPVATRLPGAAAVSPDDCAQSCAPHGGTHGATATDKGPSMTATLDTLNFHIDVLEDMLSGSRRFPPPSFELEDVFEGRRFSSKQVEPVMDPAALVLLLVIAERWQDSDGDDFGWGLGYDQCDFYQFLGLQAGGGHFEACRQALHASMASMRHLFDTESRLQWLWMTMEATNFADWECIWAAALLIEHGNSVFAPSPLDWSPTATIDELREGLPLLAEQTERVLRWAACEPRS